MEAQQGGHSVVVTDIRVPLWSLVTLMVKSAIAAIPAVAILALIWFAVTAGMTGIVAAYHAYQDRVIENAREIGARPVEIPKIPDGPTASERACAGAGNEALVRKCMAARQRCAGSADEAKCLADEEREAPMSPEQRAARAKALEDERRSNMEKVK
jgi:hypothetical protein